MRDGECGERKAIVLRMGLGISWNGKLNDGELDPDLGTRFGNGKCEWKLRMGSSSVVGWEMGRPEYGIGNGSYEC